MLFLQAATYFAYSFVTADTIWLYVVVRFAQHIMGVVVNTIMASLPYVNLPDEDRTNYLAFHTILANLSAFLSMMLGTAFTGLMGDYTLNIFGLGFSSTQILLFSCATGQVLVGLFALSSNKKLTPPELLSNPHI